MSQEQAPASGIPATSSAPSTSPSPRAEVDAILARKGVGETSSSPSSTEPTSQTASQAPSSAEGDSALAKRLARIAREEERVRSERKRHEEETKAWSEDVGRVKVVKDALAKGDKIQALQAFFSEAEMEDLYQGALTDWVLSRPAKGEAPRPEQLEELVAKQVTEKLEAEKRRQGDEAKKRHEEARDAYVGEVAATFAKSPDRWPLVAANGVAAGDIAAFVEAEYKRTQKVPTDEAVLDHFQREFESRIEAAGYARRHVEDSRGGRTSPSETVNSQWTRDNGVVTPRPPEGASLREVRESFKSRFFGQRR